MTTFLSAWFPGVGKMSPASKLSSTTCADFGGSGDPQEGSNLDDESTQDAGRSCTTKGW